VDLNVDAGEGLDDAPLVALATSVNVACGFHAGDLATMRTAVSAARLVGCAVGAHPATPDRAGFGRRPMDRLPAQVASDVGEQLETLAGVCAEAGARLHHVKLHGALYHAAWRDLAVAEAVVAAVECVDRDLWIYAPPDSCLAAAAVGRGLRLAREGFADRGVTAEGGLVARGNAQALLPDPDAAAARATGWAREGRVQAPSGVWLDWPVDTLCVHGDTPGAVHILRAIRAAWRAAGIPAQAPGP
jgi:UPF0271 protein